MRVQSMIMLGLISLALFVSSVFAQPGGDDPLPEPTPTLSPRALVGIFRTLNVNYGLETEIFDGSHSYPETSAFIQLFAQQYLGIDLHMPYAAGMDRRYIAYMDFRYEVMHLFSEPFADAMRNHLNHLNNEYYVLASIGLRKDGFAFVYTVHCATAACNTPQDHMNRFQGEAFANYGLYVPGNVEDGTDALALIQQTYPALSTLELESVNNTGEEERYDFRAQTTISIRGEETPLSYYTGTLNIPRYTLVYVIIGVGEESASAEMFTLPADQ